MQHQNKRVNLTVMLQQTETAYFCVLRGMWVHMTAKQGFQRGIPLAHDFACKV